MARASDCSLLVVAPTRRELGDLRPGLHSEGIIAATTGIGMNAGEVLHALIKRHSPNRILSLGFAGSLSRGLHTGDVLACERTLAQGKAPLPLARPTSMEGSIGVLLTATTVLSSLPDKWQARANTAADIVDMEGYHLAEAAQRVGVSLCAVRAVLDEVDEELPAFVNAIVADGGRHEWRHASMALASNPLLAKRMIRLSRQSRQASAALHKVTGDILSKQAAPWIESS